MATASACALSGKRQWFIVVTKGHSRPDGTFLSRLSRATAPPTVVLPTHPPPTLMSSPSPQTPLPLPTQQPDYYNYHSGKRIAHQISAVWVEGIETINIIQKICN